MQDFLSVLIIIITKCFIVNNIQAANLTVNISIQTTTAYNGPIYMGVNMVSSIFLTFRRYFEIIKFLHDYRVLQA